MTKEQVLGIVRHGLTFIGGILVLKGITTDATVLEVVGLTVTAIGSIWSVVSKDKKV